MATWIFLRGLTRESRHWGDFVAQFQAALPDSRVIALDLPGNGQLNQQRSPRQVQDMVAHCRAQLALRHSEPPYQVLAMSLGAMVAVAWGQAHPQEVAAQVLINTSMRPFSPFYQRLRPRNYAALLKLAVLGAGPEQWERTVLRLTSNSASDAVLPLWLALKKTSPVARANTLRQLLAAARFSAAGLQAPIPTLILASEQDHLVSVACSKTLARQWGCDIRLHLHAGHDLPLDDGPWVAAQVREWLSQRRQ
ncbi:MAG: alpha/beta hydrolase [Pseudomonadota bacterium]